MTNQPEIRKYKVSVDSFGEIIEIGYVKWRRLYNHDHTVKSEGWHFYSGQKKVSLKAWDTPSAAANSACPVRTPILHEPFEQVVHVVKDAGKFFAVDAENYYGNLTGYRTRKLAQEEADYQNHHHLSHSVQNRR